MEIDSIEEFTLEIDNVVVKAGSFFTDNLHHLLYFVTTVHIIACKIDPVFI